MSYKMAGRLAGALPLPRQVGQTLDAALDRALDVQRPLVIAHLERLRRNHPEDSPADTLRRLERQYLAAVVGIGGASGAAAALPGAGTGVSLASAAAEIMAFVSATAMFTLARAELHGIPINDAMARRTLVLSVLMGEGGAETIAALRRGEKRWGDMRSLSHQQKDKIADINRKFAPMLLSRFGTRQGALAFGRALPLGLGAMIGAGGNAALARGAIGTANKAFGKPPLVFPPRIVDL